MSSSRKTANDFIKFIDYTYLDDSNDPNKFEHFLTNAASLEVASLCVYPENIQRAHQRCPNHTLATVINYPSGDHSATKINQDILLSTEADELDVVFPYSLYLSGNTKEAFKQMTAIINQRPNNKVIKVIIESGLYQNQQDITKICKYLIKQPIHFIKTSTGKISQGATLEAAKTILNVIKGTDKGLKVSGGISTLEQAKDYYELAEKTLAEPPSPSQFRIGASRALS